MGYAVKLQKKSDSEMYYLSLYLLSGTLVQGLNGDYVTNGGVYPNDNIEYRYRTQGPNGGTQNITILRSSTLKGKHIVITNGRMTIVNTSTNYIYLDIKDIDSYSYRIAYANRTNNFSSNFSYDADISSLNKPYIEITTNTLGSNNANLRFDWYGSYVE